MPQAVVADALSIAGWHNCFDTYLPFDCAEIIKDHKALTYTLRPEDLHEAAETACRLKVSEINTIFPDVSLRCWLLLGNQNRHLDLGPCEMHCLCMWLLACVGVLPFNCLHAMSLLDVIISCGVQSPAVMSKSTKPLCCIASKVLHGPFES